MPQRFDAPINETAMRNWLDYFCSGCGLRRRGAEIRDWVEITLHPSNGTLLRLCPTCQSMPVSKLPSLTPRSPVQVAVCSLCGASVEDNTECAPHPAGWCQVIDGLHGGSIVTLCAECAECQVVTVIARRRNMNHPIIR